MIICLVLFHMLILGLYMPLEIEFEFKHPVCFKTMTNRKPTNITGSLINARTLTDGKLSDLDNYTKNDHITFLVEVNIASPLHQAIIENENILTNGSLLRRKPQKYRSVLLFVFHENTKISSR